MLDQQKLRIREQKYRASAKYFIKTKKRLIARQKLLRGLKNKPCVDCQGWFAPCQMDFDHLDPKQKRFSVCRLLNYSLENVLKEIAKCDLVCANCHRLRTFGRKYL